MLRNLFIIGLTGLFLNAPLVQAKSPTFSSCQADEHWVRAHFRRAYIRSDGVSVSASNVTAHCQKNPPSYGVWIKRLKEGLPPGWQYPKEKTKAWKEEEIERVLEALSSLPSQLLLESVKGIHRLTQSANYELNPAAGHGDEIVLYDQAFSAGKNLARILAHEFAHKLYRQISIENARSYNLAAGWISTKTGSGVPIFVPNRDAYVEEDGKEGPDEDFSNNIEYYLFRPTELQAKSPKIYDWIHNKYGDKFKLSKGAEK